MNNQAMIELLLKSNPALANNPDVQNALQMYQSGRINELQNLVMNIAKQNGVNLSDLFR